MRLPLIVTARPGGRSQVGRSATAGILGTLLVLGLPACGPGPRTQENGSATTSDSGASPRAVAEADPRADRVFRGHASYGHEVRSFRPCGEEEALWARDPSGLLWDLHAELAPGLEPYEEVFAVLRGVAGPPPADGFGADYPGEVLVGEVLYAAGEGFGCDFDWSRFRYRAQGNEPFWWAEVRPQGLRVGRMGKEETGWLAIRESADGNRLSFVAEEGSATAAELRLLSEPCRDTMSGAYFALAAELHLGDRVLRGCALPGTAPIE